MASAWSRNVMLVVVLAGAGLAAGCGGSIFGGGSSPEGKYQASDGSVTLELTGGKASLNIAQIHIDAAYTVDGNKLTIRPLEGAVSQTLVFTINKDGSLDAPQGAPFPRLLKVSGGSASSGSSSSSSSSGGLFSGLSGANGQAQSAAMAELQKHWVKRPDGWTTAVVSGSAYAPEHYLRQCKDLTINELQAGQVSEADKLNGIEWEGQATFKPTVCREAGGNGGMVLDGMGSFGPNRQVGQWSQWVDFTPGPWPFQKSKAGWEFRYDSTYLRGTLPGPQDFAAAGVQ
jgi:hypothetical protein